MALFCAAIKRFEGSPYGVVAEVMDCSFEVNEFELQSHYYLHFRTCKGMNPLIPLPSYEVNSITTVKRQGWLRHEITREGWYAIKQSSQTKRDSFFSLEVSLS